MPWRLLKFAASKKHPEARMFTAHAKLKSSYDVVIIGAGGHGLAAAYYLARDHGITNVAVLEKGYIGGGNTGRNTTIIRSNYLTPEGVKFYDTSVQLWKDLSTEFDLNLFYSTRGHYTLAHTDSAMRTMRWRAEVNKHYGIDSEVVDAQAVQRASPQMDISCGGHAPVMGALFHAPGAVARHDAVAWGYGRGADQRGVQIHQQTAVKRIVFKKAARLRCAARRRHAARPEGQPPRREDAHTAARNGPALGLPPPTGPSPTTWPSRSGAARTHRLGEADHVKVGATRVFNDVKLAVHAGSDVVVVEGVQEYAE